MARILVIAYTTYIHDGRVRRQAEGLALRGNEVEVICLADRHEGVLNGVRVTGVAMPRYRGKNRLRYLGSYLRFMAMAAMKAFARSLKRRYDVAITCTMPDVVVFCALPLKLFGSKVVLDIHDTMPELYRDKFGGRMGALGARLLMIQERMCASLADRVLAVHEPHRERLVSAHIPRNKITVLMNLPDASLFTPAACANRPEKLAGKFVLAWHGTLTQRLGVDVAILGLAILRKRVPEAHLLLIGSGDYSDDAKALVKNLDLGSRVTFVDKWVPIEQLPSMLGYADVGLVPNRSTNATRLMLPEKLLEYALLGVPVVAARLPTIEHHMGSDAIAYFSPDDPEDLVRAIEDLHAHADKRDRLTRLARERVRALGWENQLRRYVEMIDSLAGTVHQDMPGEPSIERSR